MCKQVSRLYFILLGRLPAWRQWLCCPFVRFTVTGLVRNLHPRSHTALRRRMSPCRYTCYSFVRLLYPARWMYVNVGYTHKPKQRHQIIAFLAKCSHKQRGCSTGLHTHVEMHLPMQPSLGPWRVWHNGVGRLCVVMDHYPMYNKIHIHSKAFSVNRGRTIEKLGLMSNANRSSRTDSFVMPPHPRGQSMPAQIGLWDAMRQHPGVTLLRSCFTQLGKRCRHQHRKQ